MFFPECVHVTLSTHAAASYIHIKPNAIHITTYPSATSIQLHTNTMKARHDRISPERVADSGREIRTKLTEKYQLALFVLEHVSN